MVDTFTHFSNGDAINISYKVDWYEDSRTNYVDRHHVLFEYKSIEVNFHWYGKENLAPQIGKDICRVIDIEGKQGIEHYKDSVDFMEKLYVAKVRKSNSTQHRKEYVLIGENVYDIDVYRYCPQSSTHEFFGIKIELENDRTIRETHGSKPQYNRNMPPKPKKYEECLQQVKKEIIREYEDNHVLPLKKYINELFSNQYREIKKWLDSMQILIDEERFEREYL